MSKVTITCVLGILVGVIGGDSVYADPFVPNDPYFHKGTPTENAPEGGWPGQWHLLNEHTPGLDVNIMGAWNMGYTGAGVIIGIVDEGMETTHPDLVENYVADHSWDFVNGDSDPNPVGNDEPHGTQVAGVAAARGGNSIGVTGAAPYASLASLRVAFSSNYNPQWFVDATTYHSSGSDTSIRIKNHSYSQGREYVYNASSHAVALKTSLDAGTIHCIAAGNDPDRDINSFDLQNMAGAITVTSLGSNDKISFSSSFGAAVTVTAMSSGNYETFKITTTDRTGNDGKNTNLEDDFPDDDYTSRFGGTSSASPLVAGIMALGVEAQPNLDSRFAKHLLARTSKIVDADDATKESDGGWRTNAAGISFNQNYGFGLIDAGAFCDAAANDYTNVTPLSTESTSTIVVNEAVPNNNATGITKTFSLSETTPLEEVLVTLNISYGDKGIYEFEVFITSPSGYKSRLIIEQDLDPLSPAGTIDWTYMTNAFWGENPCGDWSLTVADVDRWSDGGPHWNSYSVDTRMGELVPVPEPATMALLTLGSLGLAALRRRRKM